MATKEQVDKARAIYAKAADADTIAAAATIEAAIAAVYEAADEAADAAWNKYWELRREYENDH